MSRGPDRRGSRFVYAVRDGLRSRFAGIPDVHFAGRRNIALDAAGYLDQRRTNRSERLWFLNDDEVVKKDSYWEIRPAVWISKAEAGCLITGPFA
jgi:hypothetical protein